MKERKRIAKLFKELYAGDPWIDVTIINVLQNITPEDAVRKVLPPLNSIWEIVAHMVSWRENVLKRVKGKIMKSPADNYFSPLTDTSPAAWKALLKKLDASQTKWINLLRKFNEKEFSTIYPPNNRNYYGNIHGIIQHDAYHLGQIVILAKALK
ncbi:MAG TPA: DinB family protein [Ferruginibacter sp.]|nr:DinB family protein [Ferruginibacter sp.]